MAANDVQIRIIGQDLATTAFQSVNSAAKSTEVQITSLSRATNGLNSIFTSAVGYAAGIAGFNGLTASIQGTVGAIFNFQKSMEVHETGLAGILLSMTEINGRALTWGESLSISKNIMAQLNSEAIRTAATTEELTTAFRGILGPALSAGMTIDQITQLTVTGVNAVKSIMPASADMQRQLVQELRDLVAGGIQASSSTLATALGLKDKDIKEAKQSAEGLFKFLMDRLKGFEISAPWYAKTWQGLVDQVKEGITLGGSQGMSPLFDAIKQEISGIADQVVTFNQETNKMQVNPEIVDTFHTISDTVINAGRGIKQFGSDISVVVVPAAKLLGGAIQFAANHAELLATAGAGWVVLSKVSTAAAAGQEFLAKAVADTEARYAEQAARAAQAAAVEREAAIAAAQAQIQNTLAGTTAETAAVAAAVGQKNLSIAIEQTVIARNEESAAVARTAEIVTAANTAAKMGQYEVAEAIIATNLSMSDQAAFAATMSERLVLATTAAKAGQLELAQQILATNIVLTDQGTAAALTGEKNAAATAVAITGQRELSGAVALTTVAQTESGNAAALAGTKTVSSMAIAKTAAGNFLSSLWNLAGGWMGVALATGIAIKALVDYMDGLHKVETWNPKAEVWDDPSRPGKHLVGRNVEGQWVFDQNSEFGGYYMPQHTERKPMSDAEEEDQSAYEEYRKKMDERKPWEVDTSIQDLVNQLSGKFTSTGDDGKAAAKAARAAERAYEEQQRLQDKIADMIAKMDEKISGETATVFETSTTKLQDEVDNMKRTLDKSAIDFAKYGIDVSGVYAKIGQYQDAMTQKIEKQRNQALRELITNTANITAGVNDDPVAQAQTEYDITMAKIQKERENDEAFKKVGRNAQDEEARQAADANYAAQEAAALKKYNDSYREAQMQRYGWDVEYYSALSAMGQKTAAEMDAANAQVYDNEIQYLQNQLSQEGITEKQRADLAGKLSDAIQKKHDLAMQEYEQEMKYNDALLSTNLMTADQTDAANLEVLNNKISYLNTELAAVEKGSARERELMDEMSDAVQQKNEVLAKNLNTAYIVAIQEINNQTTNYANIMTGTLNDVNNDIVNGLEDLFSATENWGDALTDMVGNVAKRIRNMLIEIWYEQTLAKPIANWFTSVLGSLYGGTTKTATGSNYGGVNHGSGIPVLATGGLLAGPGTGTSDSILLRGSNGEYMQSAAAVSYYGVDFMDKINNRALPRFASGGLVGDYTPILSGNAVKSGSTSSQPMKVVINLNDKSGDNKVVKQQANFDSNLQELVVSVWIDANERNVGGLRDYTQGGRG